LSDDNLRLIDGARRPGCRLGKGAGASPDVSSPGTKFAYTQTNYVVMGKIIEKLSRGNPTPISCAIGSLTMPWG
jgi:CubicO group peptidase (beta-lactamase class C family)